MSEKEADTLGDALPRELVRCRELVLIYHDLGPVGAFAKMMIQLDIDRAEKAMISGDVVEMLRAYQALKGCN